MTQDKNLVLVDGSYYLFRAYHGMPQLSNRQGEPTGAIFGTVKMLQTLLNKYSPEHMAVVFDAKGKTFRNHIYPDYKAHRPPMPEDLVRQIEPIHEIVQALGIPMLIIDNVEADDVIGTLAVNAGREGINTLISTGDKDLAQLVNNRIRLLNTMNNTLLDEAGVIKKYGVAPAAITDYLALIGDTVDNVPGIPKVGPKTAVKWLQQYPSIEEIIDHADDIKGKVGENLRAHIDQLRLSKQLVTLKLDVDLPFQPQQLLRGDIDAETLRQAYQRWQFRAWLNQLEQNSISVSTVREPVVDKLETGAPPPVISAMHTDCEIILTEAALQRWLEQLKQAGLFALDTETTSLDYMQARLVGISLATTAGTAAYIPLGHDYPDAPGQLACELVLEALRPLLEDPQSSRVIGQNLKFDKHILANHGIDLAAVAHDTMLQSYVVDSTAHRHDINSLALNYLQRETARYEDLTDGGRLSFNHVNIETAAAYAAEDADIALQLHQQLWPALQKNAGLKHVYQDLELPLLPVLSRIERNGVGIDSAMLERQSRELAEQLTEIEGQAKELAQQDFNIGSPQQIQKILYEEMGLPVLAKTPKGQPSTAESVLQELAIEHELPRLILEHRGLKKLKTTYTDKLPGQINAATGRVHTSYHQAVAVTGRLSSAEPNLQNIPIRTKEGRRIRQAFIAAPGYLLLAADYSQIELRIMAHLCRDQNLLQALNEQQDIHQRTAAEVFSTPLEAVSKAQRRAAKAINFGLIYGMSAFGLSKQLGISRDQARQYMDYYFMCYPGVKDYMENTRQQARELGYVETVFGRRLQLPDINARKATLRRYAERTAINAPMQGTAADIIKRAMIDIQAWLDKCHDDVRLIMQVHDELVFEVPQEKASMLAAEIGRLMTAVADLSVPLSVDTGIGNNWDSAH